MFFPWKKKLAKLHRIFFPVLYVESHEIVKTWLNEKTPPPLKWFVLSLTKN